MDVKITCLLSSKVKYVVAVSLGLDRIIFEIDKLKFSKIEAQLL